MMLFDITIKEVLSERLQALEAYFDGDVVFYYGEIHPGLAKSFRDFIEKLREPEMRRNRLIIVLNTPGGSAETVENWTVHRTNPDKLGQLVTDEEKKTRAGEIAKLLGDNKLWHSHGRMISGNTLQTVLKLEIDDYSSDTKLRGLIRAYNDLITEYIARSNLSVFMHSKNYF